MSFSNILKKLFKNEGAGPEVKDTNVSKHISIQDWSSTYDYPIGTVARGSDGLLYMSKQPSGPSTSVKNPVNDSGTYWQKLVTVEYIQQWYTDDLLLPSDVYVNPSTGSNSNSGRSASDAFKTLRYALDFMYGSGKIQNGFKNINLAAGEYDEGPIEGLSNNDIVIRGPSSGYATLNGIDIANNQIVRLGGNIRITSDHCIEVKRLGVLRFIDGLVLNFHNWSGPYVIYAMQGGRVYGIYGSTYTISFTGSLGSCSNALLTVANGSEVSNYGTISWSGNCTGKKYSVYRLSMLYGFNYNNMPSSTTAGSVDSTSVVY